MTTLVTVAGTYLACSLIGMALGEITHEAIRHRHHRGPGGYVSRNLVFTILFFLTCGALIVSGYVNGRLAQKADQLTIQADRQGEQQDLLDKQSACQQRVFEQMAAALKARSAFGQQTRIVTLRFAEGFAGTLEVLLDPESGDRARAKAVNDLYRAQLAEIAALEEQQSIVIENHYPTQEAIEACRRSN